MKKILINLFSNSVKYNKPNGSINVIVKDRPEEIYIEVIDSGIGIPKDRISTIFDRFERIENKNWKRRIEKYHNKKNNQK